MTNKSVVDSPNHTDTTPRFCPFCGDNHVDVKYYDAFFEPVLVHEYKCLTCNISWCFRWTSVGHEPAPREVVNKLLLSFGRK